jgi:hypothetical protein
VSAAQTATVLLAGENVLQSVVLRKWLRRRQCPWQFARSFGEVCKRMSQRKFELVVCQYNLPDRTAFPLLDWLDGSGSSLFFFRWAGPHSTWVSVVYRGRRCVDGPILKAADLSRALDQILDEPVTSGPVMAGPTRTGSDALVVSAENLEPVKKDQLRRPQR